MDLKEHLNNLFSLLKQIKKSPKDFGVNTLNLLKKSSFIWGPRCNSIGLSIGHKNIIAVELDLNGEVPHLVSFAHKELSADSPNIPQELKSIFDSGAFNTNIVNTSIAGKSIIVRFIKMPKMPKKDIANSLEFEAEKYIPFDLSQVYLGFDILSEENKKYFDVALVAAKKEGVDAVIDICSKADIIPKVVDIDSFACLNAFNFAYPEKFEATVALINIGAKVTNLLIAEKSKPVFSRDIYFGGDDITVGLCKKFGMSETESVKLKYALINANDNIKEAVFDILGYLVNEVSMSFDYYKTQLGDVNIDDIYIIGGSSKLFGLGKMFEAKFDKNVIIFDALKGITVSGDIDKTLLEKYSGSLSVPLGLALRG